MEPQQRVIGVSEALLGEEEKLAVARVLDSGWISSGEEVQAFEKEFAHCHQQQDAVAVSSCTAALHLILAALGIQEGDEVLVPGVTFIATINAVLYTGAQPVPVDAMTPFCPHMSLDDAEKKISAKTKAVIIMHYGGYVANLQEWRDFCRRHNCYLIEDAAHSPWFPEVGLYSDAAAFSFFANKNMTSAEGGMILSRHEHVLEQCRLLRGHGMTVPTLARKQGHAFSYDVTALGYNMRLDELRAALGRVQLQRLEENTERRRRLTALYHTLLQERVPQVRLLPWQSAAADCHLMTCVLPQECQRRALMTFMRQQGVQTSIHYPPYHRFTWHAQLFSSISLPLAEEYMRRTITLPLYPHLHDEAVETVVHVLHKGLLEQGCSVGREAS